VPLDKPDGVVKQHCARCPAAAPACQRGLRTELWTFHSKLVFAVKESLAPAIDTA